jgi:hypothetical protein
MCVLRDSGPVAAVVCCQAILIAGSRIPAGGLRRTVVKMYLVSGTDVLFKIGNHQTTVIE